MSDRFWFHTLDYLKQRPAEGGLVNRGFWLYTPRFTPLCRLRGHRVVVDGVDMKSYVRGTRTPQIKRSRWACCDRCGVRLAQPIDSDLEIGQPYTDPIQPLPEAARNERGVIGGQLVIGGGYGSSSVQVKVGNAGSEHTLAGHIVVNKIGGLYLRTERHGTWLQRRLNPIGYDSRVISIRAENGHLSWELWARHNESSRSDPWWMHGSIEMDPRTRLWGPLRYGYSNRGEPVTAVVRMPHGDDHAVTLQLQRVRYGRSHLPKRAELSWAVDWSSDTGIPTKYTDRGRIYGSGVKVSTGAAESETGAWVAEACAAIADQLTNDRTRYGYEPPTELVDVAP